MGCAQREARSSAQECRLTQKRAIAEFVVRVFWRANVRVALRMAREPKHEAGIVCCRVGRGRLCARKESARESTLFAFHANVRLPPLKRSADKNRALITPLRTKENLFGADLVSNDLI